MCVCVLSCVHLFGTPWTVACQAPLCFPDKDTGVDCKKVNASNKE